VAAVPAVSGRTDEEKEMSMQDRRRPPRGRVETETHRPPTAKELANLHKLALQWRDEWRVKASGGMPSRTPARKAGKRDRNGPVVDNAFAEGIARAEFGRFYWNESPDDRLKAARRPRPRDEGKDKRDGKARR
jgi:hypothetical protein